MNTLDELLYYCNEPEPIGALLLSGEWGCGKTYLINHELKKALEGKAIVLRISLFGITLPDEIHEMATATAKAFEKENTSGKHEFVIYFSKVWTRNISSSEIRAEDCIVGFSTLLAELQALLSRINTGKRTFSVVHTESFIREVNVLVKKLGSKLTKNTENNSKSEEDNIENTVENTAGDTAEEAAENTAGDAAEKAAENTAGDAAEAAAEDTAGDVAEDATEDTLEDAAKHSNELSQDNSQEEPSQSTSENHPNASAPNNDNPPTCNGPETGDNLSSMSPSENEDAQ